MRQLLITMLLLTGNPVFSQIKGVEPEESAAEAGTGATWALVVGISEYSNPNIPKLKFAHRDAQAFADFLRSPAGGSLDNDHLQWLVNEQATLANVWAALLTLVEQVKEGDQAIIYFSGHGDVERVTLSQPGFEALLKKYFPAEGKE